MTMSHEPKEEDPSIPPHGHLKPVTSTTSSAQLHMKLLHHALAHIQYHHTRAQHTTFVGLHPPSPSGVPYSECLAPTEISGGDSVVLFHQRAVSLRPSAAFRPAGSPQLIRDAVGAHFTTMRSSMHRPRRIQSLGGRLAISELKGRSSKPGLTCDSSLHCWEVSTIQASHDHQGQNPRVLSTTMRLTMTSSGYGRQAGTVAMPVPTPVVQQRRDDTHLQQLSKALGDAQHHHSDGTPRNLSEHVDDEKKVHGHRAVMSVTMTSDDGCSSTFDTVAHGFGPFVHPGFTQWRHMGATHSLITPRSYRRSPATKRNTFEFRRFKILASGRLATAVYLVRWLLRAIWDVKLRQAEYISDHHGLTPGHGAATRTRTRANPTRETAGLPAKTNPKTAKSDEIWLRYGDGLGNAHPHPHPTGYNPRTRAGRATRGDH
ncbi:hypothetical protein DFP72DRAFT_1043263 [Ephemerocybe angulata]|uniref:Uncharacterized protein n=1 Tax=Ephemerocybe angulata TaxID=980116 RepID=A0A8H6MAR5_9AGAR|nr:hypothetical protein DFP72DRAFT_1043263 [Tulosesus angulatus]